MTLWLLLIPFTLTFLVGMVAGAWLVWFLYRPLTPERSAPSTDGVVAILKDQAERIERGKAS